MLLDNKFSKSKLIKWAYSLFVEEKNLKEAVALPPLGVKPIRGSLFKPLQGSTVALGTFPPLYIVGSIPTVQRGGPASVSKPQKYALNLGTRLSTPPTGVSYGPDSGSLGVFNISWVNSRNGIKNPNWKSAVRAGVTATTDMRASRSEMSFGAGSMSVDLVDNPSKIGWKRVEVAGYLTYNAPEDLTDSAFVASVNSASVAKIRDKLYAIQHDADIGETLGEYRQLLSMIGKPLQGIRDLFDLYHRRVAEIKANVMRRYGRPLSRLDRAQVAELNRAIAALWLEFTFGFKPLYYDVLGLIKAAQGKRAEVKTKMSSSFRSDKLVSDETVRNTFNNYCSMNVRTIKSLRVTVRYQVGINPKKVEALSYAERIGITPSRFVPTVYAVFPYSWLLDYFTGIDTALNSLCDNFEFTTWINKSVRVESSVEKTTAPDFGWATFLAGNVFKSASGTPAVSRALRVDIARSAPVNLITPPVLKIPTSWRPWANVTALVFAKKIRALQSLGSAALAVPT